MKYYISNGVNFPCVVCVPFSLFLSLFIVDVVISSSVRLIHVLLVNLSGS